MRKFRAVIVAVSLGMAVGACSKCEMPTYGPNACHGAAPTQTPAGLVGG